jgi:hypothetical protein
VSSAGASQKRVSFAPEARGPTSSSEPVIVTLASTGFTAIQDAAEEDSEKQEGIEETTPLKGHKGPALPLQRGWVRVLLAVLVASGWMTVSSGLIILNK